MKTPGFPVTFVSPIPGHLGLQKLVASFSEGLFVILISPVKIFGNNVGNLGLGDPGARYRRPPVELEGNHS